jgi:hypothetical protein
MKPYRAPFGRMCLMAFAFSIRLPSQSPCVEFEWTTPRTLSGPHGARVYVESPEIITSGDSVFLLSRLAFMTKPSGEALVVHSNDTLTPLLAGVRTELRSDLSLAPSEAISLPPNTWRMTAVRAARDTNGALNVAWRVPPWPNDTAFGPSVVWFSSARKGGWSRPRPILTALDHVTWMETRISSVTRSLQKPLVAVSKTEGDTLVLVSLAAETSKPKRVLFPNHIYSQVAQGSTDQDLIVAYINSDWRHPNNALFTARSSDEGEHWQLGQALTSRYQEAYAPRLLRSSEGNLHLLWLQKDRASGGETIEISTSQDGGSRWRKGRSLPLKYSPWNFSAAVDGDGLVHLTFGGSPTSGQSPEHFIWNGSEWISDPLGRSHDFLVPGPSLAVVKRNTIVVFWGVAASQTSVSITLYTIGRPVCRARTPNAHQ